MSKQQIAPARISNEGGLLELTPLARIHQEFDESFLQKLLEEHPELLPVSAMREDAGELLCIGREIAVPSGIIDNLYLSTTGYPVIVETKLWRNPQARREVLSQILDYMKDLSELDFEWLASQYQNYQNGIKSEGGNLLEKIQSMGDTETEDAGYIDRVNGALSGGNILGLIVGDGIETRLQQLVDHLCKDSAHLRYGLALCEMTFYKTDEQGSMLVLPRIIQNIEPVQRAYVRVDVAESLQSTVKVTPVLEEKNEETTPGARVSLSETEFCKTFQNNTSPQVRVALEEFYRDLETSLELEAVFKTASLLLKLPNPEGEGSPVTVLAIDKSGTVYNLNYIQGQMGRWKILPQSTINILTTDYWADLHTIDPRFRKEGVHHLDRKNFVPFENLIPHLSEIKQAITNFVNKTRKAIAATEDSRS